MEINLYGVSAIKLDKIRGRQIKKYIQTLLVIYALILFLSFCMPNRVVSFNLGQAELLEDSENQFELRFSKTFRLADT